MLRLTAIHRYPVKSCRGEALDAAEVEPWGLAGDRRWALVDATDPDGAAVTAREVNALLLVGAELTATGLRLSLPGRPDLDVAVPDPARQVPVSMWRSHLTAADAGEDAAAWWTTTTGRPVRLVHLDDPARRPTSPDFSDPDDRVSLADGYPLLITTEESLAALNDVVMAGAATGREPLPMARFRPNIVVRGAPAWAEDDWRRLRIGGSDGSGGSGGSGGVVFRAVKGCARCVMTTVDPDTGVREREPIASLARIRRFDGATWFGVNLIPDVVPGRPAVIRVGDHVEVLDEVAPGAGPIRPA